MAYKIETSTLMKESFAIFKAQWASFVGIMVLVLGLAFLKFLLDGGQPLIVSALIGFVIAIPVAIVGVGSLRFCLGAARGKKEPFSVVFSGIDVLIPFLIASIVYDISTVLGGILLVVPGVIIAVRFGFYSYYVADERLAAIDALKKSYAVTKDQFPDLLLLAWGIFGLNALGVLAFGFGLFVTIPMTMIILTKVYIGFKGA